MSNWSDEETDEPLIADHRNFYKVEKLAAAAESGRGLDSPTADLLSWGSGMCEAYYDQRSGTRDRLQRRG